QITLHRQSPTQAVVGIGVARLEVQELPQVCDGVFRLALRQERVCQVVLSLGVSGSDAHSFAEVRGRLRQLAFGLKRRPKVIERRNVIGPDAQGLAEMPDRRLDLPVRLKYRAEIEMRGEVVRVLPKLLFHERLLQGFQIFPTRGSTWSHRSAISSDDRFPATTSLGGRLGLRAFSAEL